MTVVKLDKQTLADLYEGCPECVTEIFEQFIDGYEELRSGLLAASVGEDLPFLKRHLHSHGPTFKYVGIPQLAADFKKLEYQCDETDHISQLNGEVKVLIESVEQARKVIVGELEHIRSFQ